MTGTHIDLNRLKAAQEKAALIAVNSPGHAPLFDIVDQMTQAMEPSDALSRARALAALAKAPGGRC